MASTNEEMGGIAISGLASMISNKRININDMQDSELFDMADCIVASMRNFRAVESLEYLLCMLEREIKSANKKIVWENIEIMIRKRICDYGSDLHPDAMGRLSDRLSTKDLKETPALKSAS